MKPMKYSKKKNHLIDNRHIIIHKYNRVYRIYNLSASQRYNIYFHMIYMILRVVFNTWRIKQKEFYHKIYWWCHSWTWYVDGDFYAWLKKSYSIYENKGKSIMYDLSNIQNWLFIYLFKLNGILINFFLSIL